MVARSSGLVMISLAVLNVFQKFVDIFKSCKT